MSSAQKVRVTLYLDPYALAVLGREPNSKSINGALGQYANMVEAAGYRLEDRLSPPQWEYLRAAMELREQSESWRTGHLRSLLADLCIVAAGDPTCREQLEAIGGADAAKSLAVLVTTLDPVEIVACFLALCFGLGMLANGDPVPLWWRPWVRIGAVMQCDYPGIPSEEPENGTT